MNSFCRPLNDSRQVEHFVKNILEIKTGREVNKAISLIENAEILYNQKEGKSTLLYDNHRSMNYRTNDQRRDLRKKIFEELITFKQTSNDDNIRLGYGGALPPNVCNICDKQAYIIIGLPASGKSSIAKKTSEEYGAIILDSDFAKRKLPEYKEPAGASLVHEESDQIVFGGVPDGNNTEYNVFEYCCGIGSNIVIPKIGHNVDKILELTEKLKGFDYKVHITLVSLDRQQATIRAYNRFRETKRYVPLSLIFDGYSNEPILTYYRVKYNPLFSSYGALSTKNATKIIEFNNDNPASLYT